MNKEKIRVRIRKHEEPIDIFLSRVPCIGEYISITLNDKMTIVKVLQVYHTGWAGSDISAAVETVIMR